MQSTVLLNDFADTSYDLYGSEADLSIFQPIQKAGGRWETHITRVMSRLIAPTDICLDIGANIGPFSLLMSDFAYKGHVHGFEPSEEICAFLERSVEANRRSNVTCHRFGLADMIGAHEFHTFTSIPGASFGGPRSTGLDVAAAVKDVLKYDFELATAEVQFTTLDQWAEDNNVEKVDFIKIDVEGNELFVFKGAQRLMERSRPTIITEFNSKAMKAYFSIDPSDYYDFLRSLYDHIYIVHDQGVSPVSAYEDVAAQFTDDHFWTDLLCLRDDIRTIPRATNLLRSKGDAKAFASHGGPGGEPGRLKAAYVTVVPISWTNNGGSLVCRSHIRDLSADPALDLTVITIGPGELAEADRSFIEALGCEARHVALDSEPYVQPRFEFLDAFLHPQEQFPRRCVGVAEAFRKVVDQLAPDIVVADWMFTTCHIPSFFDLTTPKVMITLNREAEFYKLEWSSARDGVWSRLCRHIVWRHLVALERRAYSACDGLVALTANDLPRDLPPHVATQVIPPVFRGAGERWRFPNNKQIFFVGNFNHFPNRLAAEWICAKLAPELEKIDPEIGFYLIGGEADDVPVSWSRKNVHILGVADHAAVAQRFTSSALFIAPIANDFGCKIKILECLTHGAPFVATAAAMSGVPYLDNAPIIDLDDSHGAARIVADLISDRHALESLSDSNEGRLERFTSEKFGCWGRFLGSVLSARGAQAGRRSRSMR